MPKITVEGKSYRPKVSSGWKNNRTRAEGGHAGSDIVYGVGKKELPQYQPPRDRSTGLGHFVPPNIPALSTCDGVVTYAKSTSKGFGVLIEHEKRTVRTFYQHLEKVFVKKDQVVKAGDTIGTVGFDPSNDNSVRHIHFELSFRVGSEWVKVDPGTHEKGYMSQWRIWTGLGAESYQAFAVAGSSGYRIAQAASAGAVQVIDRDTAMKNQNGATHKRAQADYYERVARVINAQGSQLYAAIAQFAGVAPVVTDPMTFDFTTGLWSDGKAV